MNCILQKAALRKVVLLTVALATVSASAETLKRFATRRADDTGTTSGVFKPLTDGGATSVTFSTGATNRLIKISFSAECAVLGTGPQQWVATVILVDGVEAEPAQGGDFAFCGTTDSGAHFQWTGSAEVRLITVPSIGTHTVQIQVLLGGGATEWWLGETALVIEQVP